MKEVNKKIIALGTILLILMLSVCVTYALNIFTKSSTTNIIKTGKVSMSYTETSNTINITNALPMSDEDGKKQKDYFDFSVSTNVTTNENSEDEYVIPYDVIVENTTSSTNELTNEQVKLHLTKIEGGVETEVESPILASKLNDNILHHQEDLFKNGNGTITTKYRLRAWIDKNVEVTNSNKEKYNYSFIVNINAKAERYKGMTLAQLIISKEGTDGIKMISHDADTSLQAPFDSRNVKEYRYMGSSSTAKNYVYIKENGVDKLYRIIGVLPTEDENGKIENRVKIIKSGLYAKSSYNSCSLTGDSKICPSTGKYFNDWTASLLKDTFNTTYLNSLDSEYQNLIGNAKYYLGCKTKNTYVWSRTSELWKYERMKTGNTYDTNPIDWIGKIALLSLSDYGYASSGCYESGSISNYNNTQCKTTNWILSLGTQEWTLSPSLDSGERVPYFTSVGNVNDNAPGSNKYATRPVFYLKSSVRAESGDGSYSTPYRLSLEL